jgi:endoglycosylceramidase
MTEFGAGDNLSDTARLTAFADQHLTGWMYWAYKLWNDPTGSADEGLFGNDARPSTVKTAKLKVLSHPYPQEIAGTPLAMSWDPAAKTLRFSYRPRPGTGQTVVFIPKRMDPKRYVVHVSGGTVTSGRGSMRIRIAASRHATQATVTVGPVRHG